jgi:RHH-type rel operon transcriptional repressor/antitoxin RelB
MSTSVRLAPDLDARLTNLAAQTGRTKAFYITEAITSAMDRMEYEYGILQEVEDIRAGRAKTYSLEEIKQRAELD